MIKITSAADFGRAIKEQRKERGYTQQQISDITGLSVSFLSDLENGKQTCELEKSIQVANLCGLNLLIEER